MTLGTMIVRNCSACGKHILQHNVVSGNTAHSHLWTDGKRKGPHLPGRAWLLLVKCPYCSALLWIKEQEEICEIDPWGPDCVSGNAKIVKKGYEPTLEDLLYFEAADANEQESEKYAQIRLWKAGNETECEMTDKFKDTQLISEPTFAEYIDFLSSGVHDREKELYVRIHAWWAGNDPRRQGGEASPMTQAEKTNLRALLPFLDEPSDGDRLMKAEGLRELGAFAAAEKLLATQFDDRMRKPVKFVRNLCRKGSTSVEEIPMR